MAGEWLSERREVIIDPPLPRIVLDAPASARPGEQISLAVKPAPGTALARANRAWNERCSHRCRSRSQHRPRRSLWTHLPGPSCGWEAVATDLEGETVTARTYVVVLGGGGGSGPLVSVLLRRPDRAGAGGCARAGRARRTPFDGGRGPGHPAVAAAWWAPG